MSVRVRAPMSSANLGSGFDVLAVALDAFHDVVELRIVGEGVEGLRISVRGPYSDHVPPGPENSVAGPLRRLLGEVGERLQLEVVVEKGVPPGKGLGSSGASSAAAAYALNELLGRPLDTADLVLAAGEGERIASGEPHYDNVSASLLGGFVLVNPGARPPAVRISGGGGFSFLIAVPEVGFRGKKTGIARSALPKHVPLGDVVANSSALATLIYGIVSGKPEIAGKGMADRVVEPAREAAGLLPAYSEVRRAALEAGAYGVSVSGAGPSILVLADEELHEKIGERILRIYAEKGLGARMISAKPAPGAHEIL